MDDKLGGGGNVYGKTVLGGQSTAILGNSYRDVYIANATILLAPTAPGTFGINRIPTQRIERHNRILPTHTIETVKVFDYGQNETQNGASQQTELRWERREDLGAGVFGEVHREECSGDNMPKSRAVKVLRRRQLKFLKVNYMREIGALIRLSHPDYVHRFVEFYAWYEDRDKISLSMEYISNGDLTKHIGRGLGEAAAKQIAVQVLDGITVMHRLDIVHRDIKPANIFVVQSKPIWWVKIGDFSICKSTITQHTSLHTAVGTFGYQAPEIIGFIDTEKANHYNAKCDVWSFGALLYQIITARVPFPLRSDLRAYCNDAETFPASPLVAAGMSTLCKNLIKRTLQSDPKERPTSEDAAEQARIWCETEHPRFDQTTSLANPPKLETTYTDNGGKLPVAAIDNEEHNPAMNSSEELRNSEQPSGIAIHTSITRLKECSENAVQAANSETVAIEKQESPDPVQVAAHLESKVARPTPNDSSIDSVNVRKSPIHFTCAIGRKYSLPWNRVRKWNQMRTFINQAFESFPEHYPHVSLGRFDLADVDGSVVLPNDWEEKSVPGSQIVMKFWPIHFTCALGRNYKFPWHKFHKWTEIQPMINQAFQPVPELCLHVQNGHYDLMDADQNIVLPTSWEDQVRPGIKIAMMLWPIPESEPDITPSTEQTAENVTEPEIVRKAQTTPTSSSRRENFQQQRRTLSAQKAKAEVAGKALRSVGETSPARNENKSPAINVKKNDRKHSRRINTSDDTNSHEAMKQPLEQPTAVPPSPFSVRRQNNKRKSKSEVKVPHSFLFWMMGG